MCHFYSLTVGSWQVGVARGSSPLELQLPASAAITCHTVQGPAVSFVADPFLVRGVRAPGSRV